VRVLVVNAGSSTVKLSLIGDDHETLAARELSAPRSQVDTAELRAALDEGLGEADVIGHRIVHGGERFHEAALISGEVERELRELTDLAPLHQPKSLAALDAVTTALPEIPSVACFDTAFHADMPAAAATYAVPAAWRERWGLRRYGFHGLSHGWVARRAPALASGPARRIVNCHLGAGGSLCAISDGRSIDTTMGFTPLEGLVMATRSGSVDPGLIVWLLQHDRLTLDEVAIGLEQSAGLCGLAGQPGGDIRDVQRAAAAGDPAAQVAIDVYVHRLRREIAAMAAAMNGIDAIVFTGGIGEHNPAVRAAAAGGLGFLGVKVDPDRNHATTDAIISVPDAATVGLVVTAREDLEIARQARAVLLRPICGTGAC
jgi:acetate kinase